MFLDTGSKVGELADIKTEEIDPERGWVKVRDKGAKERVARI